MPQPHEHAQDRNFIEDILRRIPGFRGYLEKEYRRESDQLQRRWLAEQLQRAKRAIDELARPLADSGRIDLLPLLDRPRNRLDKLIGRIRGAMHGYSGFFDLVRVDQALLERVYEHDLALADQLDALVESVERLPTRQDDIPEAVAEVQERIDAVGRQWDLRADMLTGLK